MLLVSDDDGNDEFLDFDDDIAVFTVHDANVDINVASLETTEVDEIAEPVFIGSRKRKSNSSNWKKNITSDSHRKGKKYTDCKGNEKAAKEQRHKTVTPAVISVTKIFQKLLGFQFVMNIGR